MRDRIAEPARRLEGVAEVEEGRGVVGLKSPRVLEVASARLSDGTILQVGKSNEIRLALLRQFQRIVGLVSVIALLVGVAGGLRRPLGWPPGGLWCWRPEPKTCRLVRLPDHLNRTSDRRGLRDRFTRGPEFVEI